MEGVTIFRVSTHIYMCIYSNPMRLSLTFREVYSAVRFGTTLIKGYIIHIKSENGLMIPKQIISSPVSR